MPAGSTVHPAPQTLLTAPTIRLLQELAHILKMLAFVAASSRNVNLLVTQLAVHLDVSLVLAGVIISAIFSMTVVTTLKQLAMHVRFLVVVGG